MAEQLSIPPTSTAPSKQRSPIDQTLGAGASAPNGVTKRKQSKSRNGKKFPSYPPARTTSSLHHPSPRIGAVPPFNDIGAHEHLLFTSTPL